MIRRLAQLAALAVISVACGAAQKPPRLEDALAESRDDGKVLIAEFSAEWCQPCQRFAAEILPDAEVQRAMADVELLSYVDENPRGHATRKRFGVESFPTFLVIGGGGKPVAHMLGVSTPERFIGFVEYAQLVAFTRADLEKRLALGRTPRRLVIAGRWASVRGQHAAALAAFNEALAQHPTGRDLAAADYYRALEISVGGTAAELATRLVEFLERHPHSAPAEEARELALVPRALPPERADAAARAAASRATPDERNHLTYVLIAADQCPVAVDVARAQLRDEPDSPNAHDTLAEALHCAGNTAEALKEVDLAISAARGPAQVLYQNNRARFAQGQGRPSKEVKTLREHARKRLAGLHIHHSSTPPADSPSPPSSQSHASTPVPPVASAPATDSPSAPQAPNRTLVPLAQ